jgi:hypothetical protein
MKRILYFVFQSYLEEVMTQADAASPDDLAYVRHLAESGARAPLIGGRFMAWWGLLIAVAYTAQHLALNGVIGGGIIYGIIWGSFGILGMTGQLLLSRTIAGKAGAGSAGNRASRSVWTAAACAIASMVVGVMVLARNGSPPPVFDWVVPVAFAVYACCLIVTGALAGDRITVAAGGGAVIMVGLFTAFILNPDRYLLAAAGGAATVMLPGLLLMGREPKAAE